MKQTVSLIVAIMFFAFTASNVVANTVSIDNATIVSPKKGDNKDKACCAHPGSEECKKNCKHADKKDCEKKDKKCCDKKDDKKCCAKKKESCDKKSKE